MDLTKLCGILEDRHTELYQLMGADESKSIDWYDGASDELARTISLIKRHLTSSSSRVATHCDCGGHFVPLIGSENYCEWCGKKPPPA